MSLTPRRPLPLSSVLPAVALLSAAATLLGCGGASVTSGTLPHEEASQLDLVPRDAFFAGRLDMGALRATPHWAFIQERMREEDTTMAELAERTGRLYFAVGGLVPAPPVPPMFDAEQNYQPQPQWAELARYFGGRIPKMVAIVEGGLASMCTLATEGASGRERSGYRIVDVLGVAVITRGESFCALTWTPLVDALLAETGPTAEIASHLAVEGGGVAQLALRLDGPVVAEMLADSERQDASTVEEAPPMDDWSEAQIEEYRAEMAASHARQQRMANFSRAVSRILLHGLVAGTWRLRSDGEGFETRTQVVTNDDGRMTMWRELTEVFFDILRALVGYEVLPGEGHPTLAEFVRDVRIEEQRGGFEIVRHTSHAIVAELLRGAVPRNVEEYVEVVEDPEAGERDALEGRIAAAEQATAREVIAALEPNVSFLRERSNVYFRIRMLGVLANAYASVGRFADGRALMDAEMAYLRAYESDDDDSTPGVRESACVDASLACEISLAHGDAELALETARSQSPSGQGTCAQTNFQALSCEAAALATLGRTDEGLALLATGANSPAGQAYMEAHTRVLALGGRFAEVLSIARSYCPSSGNHPSCQPLAAVYADSLAGTARTVAAVEPVFVVLHQRHRLGTGSQENDERAIRVQAADCALRARVAASAEPSRVACALALEHALEVHGETHPQVAAIRVNYARALQAARQRDEAATQRQAAAAVIETLGPQHPLRGR